MTELTQPFIIKRERQKQNKNWKIRQIKMGKKEKNKKKGKGAEKTIEKTQKKLKSKVLKATGEDDIESIVKAIEEEEKKRRGRK